MSEERESQQASGEGSGIASRLKQSGGGRSSFVYIVVGVVAITLTLLLAIIYFSASERERTSPPICTDITLEEAEQAVLGGDVERMTIVYDSTPHTPTSNRYGPVLAKLDYIDDTCSNLPQGVANQETVYTIAGVIAFYNENTEGQQVEIIYQTSDRLDQRLFAMPTEPPTNTPAPVVTIAPANETSDLTQPPIVPAGTPVAAGTVVASPAATPASTTVVATP